MIKKSIIFAILFMVTVGAAAIDRFYIEDFTIAPGETQTVSILLENETAYTAFQVDIYLPEGLTVEQEDGDYIFDLTSRKARDHNIASQLQPNGSIRVMSYSPRIYAYSDNSGALVTFNVIASNDFEGPVIIELRNTLFTTTAGTEIPFSDETCTVTTPSTVHKGDVNGDFFVTIRDVTILINYLLSHDSTDFNPENADMDDNGVIAIRDVTMLINNLLSGNI